VRYLLALLVPPLAMFTCGKVFQGILCIVLMLTLIGWPLAAVWAVLVVADYKAEKRMEKLAASLRGQR